MPEKPPVPEPFVNEDLSKPENRTNLALFGLMLIPGIRTWLLKRLDLPVDSIVYPPQNTQGGRPDFVVVGPNETVVAWIEVELGGENQGQLARYRTHHHPTPIKSIVGLQTNVGDLSLEEIAEAVSGPLDAFLDRQQAMNVGVFTDLVAKLAGKIETVEYVSPTDELRERPLVRALHSRLGDVLQFGIPPVTPGTAQVSTITQKGWTLRVYSKAASMRTVSLLWDQVSSRSEVRVPSQARLDRCFPKASDEVGQYVALCKGLGADVTQLAEAQSLAIPETKVLSEIVRLVACIRALATVYGGGAAPS